MVGVPSVTVRWDSSGCVDADMAVIDAITGAAFAAGATEVEYTAEPPRLEHARHKRDVTR